MLILIVRLFQTVTSRQFRKRAHFRIWGRHNGFSSMVGLQLLLIYRPFKLQTDVSASITTAA
jgi:hypothetical protein